MPSMSDIKGVKSHVTASVSWHHKGVLQFYNDEPDKPTVEIKKVFKSRKSKRQTDEVYRQRLIAWKATSPHDVWDQIERMTQQYYAANLLSVYVDEIHTCRLRNDRYCIFQKDNDLSQDIKSKDNVVNRFKAPRALPPPKKEEKTSISSFCNINI